jgi:hypothetical protein
MNGWMASVMMTRTLPPGVWTEEKKKNLPKEFRCTTVGILGEKDTGTNLNGFHAMTMVARGTYMYGRWHNSGRGLMKTSRKLPGSSIRPYDIVTGG